MTEVIQLYTDELPSPELFQQELESGKTRYLSESNSELPSICAKASWANILTASMLHGLYRIHQTMSRETVYTSVDGMAAATVAVDQSSIKRKD